MTTDYLFLLLTFPIASILHGGDYFPKGWIVAIHGVTSLVAGLYAPISVACYWAFLRRGEQARAELDYLAGKGSLDAVRGAYPLYLGYLVAPVVKHVTTRREQEFVSASILGSILALWGLL